MTKKSDITNFTKAPRRHAAQGSQPDLIELGRAVRQARLGMGLTQAQLSLVSGTSRDTIIALESGRSSVSLGNAMRVLKGLGLTLAPRERG